MSYDILLQPNNNIPIAVIEWGPFLAQLPSCFRIESGGMVSHDPSQVNVFTNPRKNFFLNASKKVMKVNTPEEFNIIRSRLLTLPIFVQLTLERKRKFVEHLKKRIRYMVCLNPQNPVIRAQLESQFAKCEQLMLGGHKFCLELKLGAVIRHWYKNNEARLFKRYQCHDSAICITNHKKRKTSCYNYKMWIAFLPVMIFVGPIYIILRLIRCQDIRCNIEGFVTKM